METRNRVSKPLLPMTPDTLVVVTFGHGGQHGAEHRTLYMADPDSCWKFYYKQELIDTAYAQLFDQLDCFQVHLMQQCHAGGFIDDLQAPNRVILTACSTEMAYAADNVILQNSAWDSIPGSENEVRGDSVYKHGEFLLHILGAMRSVNSHYGIDPAPWENPYVIADYDSNGQVFLDEIWQWEWEHDSHYWCPDEPKSIPLFSDSGQWAHTFMVHDPVDAPENMAVTQIETPAECATCHSGYYTNHVTWDDRPSTENRAYFDVYCIRGTNCITCHTPDSVGTVPCEEMTFEEIGEEEILCPEMIPDGYDELFVPAFSYTSDCPDTSGEEGELHPMTRILGDSLLDCSFTHPDVVTGTTYAYTVKTTGPLGYVSGFSEWADISVAPPPPDGLTVWVVGDDAILRWQEVPGIELYFVYRGTTPDTLSYLGAAYGANPTTYTDSSAVGGERYLYHITARY